MTRLLSKEERERIRADLAKCSDEDRENFGAAPEMLQRAHRAMHDDMGGLLDHADAMDDALAEARAEVALIKTVSEVNLHLAERAARLDPLVTALLEAIAHCESRGWPAPELVQIAAARLREAKKGKA